MNRIEKAGKAKAGLLLIGSPRFKNLSGPERGTYGERKEKAVEEILATLDFVDLTYPGIVYERQDAENAISRFFSEKVDFVIAEFLSWSEDFAWIRFLRDMPDIPMIFVNVAKDKMTFETTLDEDDFIDYLCAGTLVGSLEASGSVKRVPRKNVKVVMGTRAEVTEKIRTFACAAKARAVLRRSNVGLMANMNEAMWSTYIDNYDLFTKIGPEIHYLPYSDYGEEINNLTDKETEEYCNELTSKYRMMDDVEYDKFVGCVKASLALKKMAEHNDIDVMVYNDIDQATFKTAGCRAGFYHTWFNDNVSVLVPEADIGAGIITYVLKIMTGKHINFLEPFHVEDAYGTFAGGHAGPAAVPGDRLDHLLCQAAGAPQDPAGEWERHPALYPAEPAIQRQFRFREQNHHPGATLQQFQNEPVLYAVYPLYFNGMEGHLLCYLCRQHRIQPDADGAGEGENQPLYERAGCGSRRNL